MDPEDFTARVDPYYAALVRRLTLVLHDNQEAQDVAQETYLRAWRAWPRFDGRDVRAWLHTIGLRVAFSRLRRRRLWQALLRRRVEPPSWVLPERLDLWNAIGALPEQQRAALLLTAVDGYTQAQVGQILGAPAGTVAGRVAAAKRRVRAALDEASMASPSVTQEVLP